MIQECTINDLNYTLYIDEYGLPAYSKALDKLTEEIFSINFKKFYDQGYFNNQIHFYSLMFEDIAVAHVTATEQTVSIKNGKEYDKYQLLQIGTVCTAPKFRGLGLSKWLLNKVINKWQEKCDAIYLYANDSVLNYYPKFGFCKIDEHIVQRSILNERLPIENTFRKIETSSETDLNLLKEIMLSCVPMHKLHYLNSLNLNMLYLDTLQLFAGKVYYSSTHQTVVILEEREEDELVVADLFTINPCLNIKSVLLELCHEGYKSIKLIFTPEDCSEWEIIPFKEDDSTLMVYGASEAMIESLPLTVPYLYRT